MILDFVLWPLRTLSPLVATAAWPSAEVPLANDAMSDRNTNAWRAVDIVIACWYAAKLLATSEMSKISGWSSMTGDHDHQDRRLGITRIIRISPRAMAAPSAKGLTGY